MKSQPILVLALSLLVLGGCASAPETNRALDRLKPATAEAIRAQRELVTGRWYGEALTNEGQTRRWLRENFAEGTYKLTIRDYQKDESFVQQTEVGQWGLSGPIYFTIMKGWQIGSDFRNADSANPYYQDAYQILELGPELWIYQHAETGLQFRVKRVADDFTLPGKLPEPPKVEKPKAAAKAKAKKTTKPVKKKK